MNPNFSSLAAKYRVILSNAVSLIASTAVTSGLGFFYWLLAARQFQPDAVGLGSAAISAMMFLGNVCMLGFGTLLIGELPRQPGKEGSLISTALLLVGAAGCALGLLFAFMAPWVSTDLYVLAENFGNACLFALGVSLTAVTLVLDQAMVGLLRSDLQLWRNAIFAIAKLVALIIVGTWATRKLGLTIYVTWLGGNLASLIILCGYAFWKNSRKFTIKPNLELLSKLGSTALEHHVLNLTLLASGLMMPIIVTAELSARMNAYFYTSWMIASFATVVSVSLTTVLYAVGSGNPEALAAKVRFALRISFLAGILTCFTLLVGAEFVLGLFKPDYAGEAGSSLRIMGFAVFPLIVKNFFIAIQRIHKQILRTAFWMMAGGALELTLAVTGAKLGGLAGLSLGWVIAMSIEALFMARTVYRVAVPASMPNLLSAVAESEQSLKSTGSLSVDRESAKRV